VERVRTLRNWTLNLKAVKGGNRRRFMMNNELVLNFEVVLVKVELVSNHFPDVKVQKADL